MSKFCSKYICLLGFFYLKLFICPSESILASKFCSKYICLLGFFYLKLFICPSESILASKFCSKYICLLGFFYLKLFICPSDVKRPKAFMSFTSLTRIKAPLWISCRACNTLRPSPAFYNIQKLNLSSKNEY